MTPLLSQGFSVALLVTLLVGAGLAPADAKIIRDLEFARVEGHALKLDLYLPEGKPLAPLVVYIHGGAWQAGSRQEMPLGRLVALGYPVASVDYRLSTAAVFPAQAYDLKAAIRFLRAKGKDFGVETDCLAVAGSSAGGHLAALIGVTNGVKELEGDEGECRGTSSDVQAIVSFFGASDLQTILAQSTPHGLSVRVPALQRLLGGQPSEKPELARLASPVAYVDAHDPPLLLIHGDADPQMPYEQAVELQHAYEKVQRPVQLLTIPGGQHGGREFYDDERTSQIAAFLQKSMATGAPRPVSAAPAPDLAEVAYGPAPHQRLDVYLPPAGPTPAPAIIWYGGLWQPAKHPVDLHRFLPAGIAVIAVESRTLTDATQEHAVPPISYPMLDALRSVQYVRTHAAEWHLDPQRLAVGGGSQGSLPALFVGGAGERARPESNDPVERASTRVTCVAAYRSQPSIDPRRMQAWVPGVSWGAPALGCSFEESLRRYGELQSAIETWSPDALLHAGAPPIYFENDWGLTQPAGVTEADYRVHSPAWALGFQRLAEASQVVCYVKYPGHPTEPYRDIWDFVEQSLKKPVR